MQQTVTFHGDPESLSPGTAGSKREWMGTELLWESQSLHHPGNTLTVRDGEEIAYLARFDLWTAVAATSFLPLAQMHAAAPHLNELLFTIQ